MRPELQAYLDGELRLADLPAELREEAERWERLLADLRELGPESAPGDLAGAIVEALPEPGRLPALRRAAEWIARPRTIRVSPLAGLAAAAALAFILLLPKGDESGLPPGLQDGATIYVQFVLEAPAARSVAVAGDFNEWSPGVALSDPDGDGIWTGRVALKPGVHQYMFVIDGKEWRTDPNADRYSEDGFGNRNAVLVIGQPTAQS